MDMSYRRVDRINRLDALLGIVFSFYFMFERFIKYSFIGGIATICGGLSLYFITEAGVYYLLSSLVTKVICFTVWFIGQSVITFGDRKTTMEIFWKALPTKGICMLAAYGLLAFFTEVVGLWYMASACVATIIVFFISYAISNKWVWNKKGVLEEAGEC